MATKTNKMFAKRLKVTKNGKVLARAGGKNHFNAKEKRRTQMANKRYQEFRMTANDVGHYMPNA